MGVTQSTYYSANSGTYLMGIAPLYTGFAHLFFKLLSLTPYHYKTKPLDLHQCFVTTESSKSIAIVTGSNTGIGFETASSLVEHGYTVILACRSRSKGETAAEKINKASSSSSGKAIFLHPLDLSCFSSVREFSEKFYEKYEADALNILVNNAGLNASGNGVSDDGLDLVYQSNTLGHFLLTKLLMPKLEQAKNIYFDDTDKSKVERGRVVNLSSVMHHFNQVSYDMNKKDFWVKRSVPGVSDNTYSESKLASILFSMELNKRYDKIRSVSVNPGAVNSDIWRDIPKTLMKYIVGPVFSLLFLTTKQGSRTSFAGSISKLPSEEGDSDIIYLQPYWLPSSNTPFPMFEMMGPFIGHALTNPRMPASGQHITEMGNAFWEACEEITNGKGIK